MRTAARDALLAGASEERYRGRVFGFHRGLDTLGAMIGPLAAFVLIRLFEENLRIIFYIAFLPAVAGVILLAFFVRDMRRDGLPERVLPFKLHNLRLTRGFKIFLIASTIFALGNSSDAFIILKAHTMGLSVGTTILAYALFNVVYAVFSLPAGIVSDRIGQRKVLLGGFALFAIIYFLFGITHRPVFLWVLFPLYGVYMALTEGIGKAYISLHAKGNYAGTTYGIYQTATGLAAFPASVAAGLLWKYAGPGAPFFFGAALSLIALAVFGLMHDDVGNGNRDTGGKIKSGIGAADGI